MTDGRLVHLLYCRDQRLRDRLTGLLADLAIETVTSRADLEGTRARPCAIVYGMTRCSDVDVPWLRWMTRESLPGSPCIVVAPLSVECLRRLNPLRSRSLRLVWAEEAEDCLFRVVRDMGRDSRDPLWQLGWRLLSDCPFRPAMREVITRTCGLDCRNNRTDPPNNSVRELASRVHLSAQALSRHWKEDVPLQCSLKEFLDWAVLLWAARASSKDSCGEVALQAGVHRRTMERKCARLAGSTFAAVRENPEAAVRRFREWYEGVREPV